MFPIGYQPPPQSVMPNLASALSQMSLSQHQSQPQSALDRRDSFSSKAQMNYGPPHGIPPPQSPYFVMTPPNGLHFEEDFTLQITSQKFFC